jgi:hypothetical protein
MAQQSHLVVAFLALVTILGAGASHAASQQWGRYGQPGAEHRSPPGPGPARPDNRGGMPPGGTQYGTAEQEQARRAARMSPEQRRDLRRQINEAGQDIYPAPRR